MTIDTTYEDEWVKDLTAWHASYYSDQGISGPFSWTGNSGQSVTIKYSLDSLDSFFVNSGIGDAPSTVSDIGATASEIENILGLISNVADIIFVRDETNPDIVFSSADLSYLPGGYYSGLTVLDVDGQQAQQADVYISSNQTDFSLGGTGSAVLLHEVLHALGISHPEDSESDPLTNPSGYDTDFDNLLTAQSYNQNIHNSADATTPMVYDVAALQFLYGANTSRYEGNTVYTLSETGVITVSDSIDGNGSITGDLVTVWDAGGIDEYKLSAGITSGAWIDLRAGISDGSDGQYSSGESYFTQLDFLGNGNVVIVNAFPVGGVDGDGLIENATGATGNDVIFGNNLNNVLTGLGGDDEFWGGLGDDTLDGGDGNDIYHYSLGDGNDTIINDVISNDTIIFDSGISFDDVIISFSGNDMIFSLPGSGSITISNYDQGTGVSRDYFTFSESSVTMDWLTGGTGSTFISGTNNNDLITGGALGETINGRYGRDVIYGGSGNDIIYAATSSQDEFDSNFIYGGGGDDAIDGSYGDDYIDGGDGNDSISSGGGSDTLIGGIGDDIIGSYGGSSIYGGAGSDWLQSSGSNDTVDAGSGDDLIELLANGGSGTQYAEGASGNDEFAGRLNQEWWNLTWIDSSGNDSYLPGGGNTTITDSDGDDTYKSTFITNKSDVIINDTGGTDLIYLLPTDGYGGYTVSDYDVTLDIEGGRITLKDHLDPSGLHAIEYYQKGTNPAVSLNSLIADFWGDYTDNTYSGTSLPELLFGEDGNDTLSGNDGNDYLSGGAGDDMLSGDLGDDTLIGGAGNDSYFYVPGGGDDILFEAGGFDTIELDAAMTLDGLSFYLNGNDLVISGYSSMTVTDQYSGDSSRIIEQLRFDDGSTFQLSDLVLGTSGNDILVGNNNDNVIFASSGNDSLQGDAGNDLLRGETGDDQLFGGVGDDEYVFKLGDGQDTIDDDNGATDFIRLGAEFSATNIVLTETGTYDLEITFTNSPGDKITILGHRDGSGTRQIEKIVFSDGSEVALTGPNIIEGTSSNDTINGTTGDDLIYGYEGHDTIYGNGGNDIFYAGVGNDYIYTSSGDDIAYGEAGNDQFYDNGGSDIYDGGDGTLDRVDYTSATSGITVDLVAGTVDENGDGIAEDTLTGIETITSTPYNDILYGDSLKNNLAGMDGDDLIDGGGNGDTLRGGDGNDVIYGGDGNDIIYGDNGSNQLFGDGGNDGFFAHGGYDLIDGGAGTDSLNYSFSTLGVEIDVGNGTVDVGRDGSIDDTFVSIEDFYGSNHDDVLIASDDGDWLTGRSGDDLLIGGAGIDKLTGQNDNDTLYGNGGNDQLFGDNGDDVLYGDAGNDTLKGGNNNDLLYGGEGLDTLYGQAGADTFIFENGMTLNDVDSIMDFNTSDGDAIDISGLLDLYDPMTDAIADFVQITTDGVDSSIIVDRDGTDSVYAGQLVANLDNVTGLDVQTLENNGNLITA